MAQKSTTAATTTPAEGVGPGKVFPPLDHTTFVPQLVWLAISFGLLYLLLKRVALPRVGASWLESIASRVDFPDPDSPTTASTSPLCTSSATSTQPTRGP